FKDQLQYNFKRGIFDDITAKFGTRMNLLENISDNSNLKFNDKLMTFGAYGKFKGKQEGYSLLFDFTPVHDNFFHRLLLDTYIESNRIKNNKIIIGTSRPTVGIEGGMSPYLIPFVEKSQIARNFGGIRKTGLRVLGDYKYINYDMGGYSSDTRYTEFFPGVECDLWLGVKPLANYKKYGNLNLAGGYNAGSRNSKDFQVTSAAILYDYKNLWFRAEYGYADGSNGYNGMTTKKREGYNATLGYYLTKKFEIVARYDDFNPDKKIKQNNTKEYSAGMNYYILGQGMKLMLNYVYCDNQAMKNSHKIMFLTQIML
ncbi:hypothetical protein IJ531_00080, partial [bacterium]|nr:hypothetical protein [bacterium]